MNKGLENIYEAILEGQMETAKEQTQVGIDAKIPAGEILNQGLIRAMGEVGSRFEKGECFLPEMLISARAMKECLSLLRPLLIESDVPPVGTVVLGTVQGDLHDIGKNLVGMMLEGAGFTVTDLGVDVSPEQFVTAVQETKPDIVAMSALLTTTMQHIKVTIKALKEAGVLEGTKVIVGGAPVTEAFAQEVGADGFAPDASQASSLATEMIT